MWEREIGIWEKCRYCFFMSRQSVSMLKSCNCVCFKWGEPNCMHLMLFSKLLKMIHLQLYFFSLSLVSLFSFLFPTSHKTCSCFFFFLLIVVLMMGRPPCCDKSNVKRGPWTPEEDAKILAYVSRHGIGNWTLVPQKAGKKKILDRFHFDSSSYKQQLV